MDALSVRSFASDMSSVSRSTKKSKSHSSKSLMKFGSSVSQDSAFGSMIDYELSSSIGTNSVQSIATSSDNGLGDSTTSIFGSTPGKAKKLDGFMPTCKTTSMIRQSSYCGPTSSKSTEIRAMRNKYKSEEFEVDVDGINYKFSSGCVISEK